MKRPSLRDAIDAKCKDCIYDSNADGTWRDQVEACTSGNCPLYDVRPKSWQTVRNEALKAE